MNKCSKPFLHFFRSFSKESKKSVDENVVEIVEDEDQSYKPPYISLEGFSFEKSRKVYVLHTQN